MGIKLKILIISVFFCYLVALPVVVWAGGHEACGMCHKDVEGNTHELVIEPDYQQLNPITGRPFNRNDALCMACHSFRHGRTIHPVGIIPNPNKVILPAESRGFSGQENEIGCWSCHDPHPDNKNYMYLRWLEAGDQNLANFCVAKCHTSFAKPDLSSRIKLVGPIN